MQYSQLQFPAEVQSMVESKTAKPKDGSFYMALASLVATVIGIPIMFLTWIEPHLENDQKNQISIEVGNQLKEPIKTMGEANTHLSKIETSLDDLKPFIRDVVDHQFENVSKLSSKELGERLPALKGLLAVAKDQDVKAKPQITEALGKKMLQINSEAVSYWPTASEFINYRSRIGVTNPEKLTQPSLPNCRDQAPGGMRVESIDRPPGSAGPETVQVGNAKFSDCRMELDSPEDAAVFNLILQRKSPRIAFTHCLIVYRGGAINIILAFNNDMRFVSYRDVNGVWHKMGKTSLSGPTLVFVDCLLDFSVAAHPPPSGRKATEVLLAQNGSTYTLP
ncbi:hypothetical protein P8935_12485 [Telmatobacter sp. DSM 110680]|uniref:Uncharacterized protein n=1 Tax=Telmatobacter sp. DSM 110680 TaxID=3036704 RepID=A0AAU7DDJ0_9BACT